MATACTAAAAAVLRTPSRCGSAAAEEAKSEWSLSRYDAQASKASAFAFGSWNASASARSGARPRYPVHAIHARAAAARRARPSAVKTADDGVVERAYLLQEAEAFDARSGRVALVEQLTEGRLAERLADALWPAMERLADEDAWAPE